MKLLTKQLILTVGMMALSLNGYASAGSSAHDDFVVTRDWTIDEFTSSFAFLTLGSQRKAELYRLEKDNDDSYFWFRISASKDSEYAYEEAEPSLKSIKINDKLHISAIGNNRRGFPLTLKPNKDYKWVSPPQNADLYNEKRTKLVGGSIRSGDSVDFTSDSSSFHATPISNLALVMREKEYNSESVSRFSIKPEPHSMMVFVNNSSRKFTYIIKFDSLDNAEFSRGLLKEAEYNEKK